MAGKSVGALSIDYAGETLSGMSGGVDAFVAAIRDDGDSGGDLWFQRAAGPLTEQFSAVTVQLDGTIVAAGQFRGAITVDQEPLVAASSDQLIASKRLSTSPP